MAISQQITYGTQLPLLLTLSIYIPVGNARWLLRPTRYQSLGGTEKEHQSRYRALFGAHVDGVLLDKIRKSANRGLALGG